MIEKGVVVRSIAGRDKHRYFVVVASDEHWVYLADGKLRKLEAPKRKNLKHIQTTSTKITLGEITSNKYLARTLREMNEALRQGGNPKGGS